MKRFLFVLGAVLLLPVSVSFGYPTLDQILGSDVIGESGADGVRLTDFTDPETSLAIIQLENSTGEATFGLYNLSDPAVRLRLFDPADEPTIPTTQTEVEFDLATGLATIIDSPGGLYNGDSALIGTTFGFYLTNLSGATYFTDESLNGGAEQIGIYDKPGANVVVACEFGGIGGDRDYDDMVVEVTDVCAIPAPGAILLGCIGTGLVGWMRRRRNL